jgi:hypothetical protein
VGVALKDRWRGVARNCLAAREPWPKIYSPRIMSVSAIMRIRFISFWLMAILAASVCAGSTIDKMPPRIVPGVSIGSVVLGNNGAETLRKLPKPYASEAGMSQTRQVWKLPQSKGRYDTLFIHTVSNGVIDAQPPGGVTIDLIRTSAKRFRTAQGISVGSSLEQIRKTFPGVAPVAGVPTVFDAVQEGIAFEFEQNPDAHSPSNAIMVHAPGQSRVATQEQVASVMESGGGQ